MAVAAGAARQLLLLMAQLPQIRLSLDQWLDNPPLQEAAAVPLLLAGRRFLPGALHCCRLPATLCFTSTQRRNTGASVTIPPARPPLMSRWPSSWGRSPA